MQRTLLILLLVLLLKAGLAQPNFVWARQTGGTESDIGFSVSVDTSGNVYTAGNFRGTVDFDHGAGTYSLTSFGSDDAFVTKCDAAGNFIWVKRFGGLSFDQASAVVADGSGNLYVAGFFQGTADFDPGPAVYNLSSNGSNDVFILKLNALGNFVWARQVGGPSSDMCYSLAADSARNIYVTGHFIGTIDLDPGHGIYNLASAGAQDIFILKLDPAGNFVWGAGLGGPSSDLCNSVAVDRSGNVYTTGAFLGTSDFDPGSAVFNLTSSGFLDIFISKLDASGNFVWAKQLGQASQDDQGGSVAVDAFGNICVTGSFQGSVDFDPGSGVHMLSSYGYNDAFVLRLDAAGNFGWARQIGGPYDDRGLSIVTDRQRNVYTTGSFEASADLNPGPGQYILNAQGLDDIYISKLDTAGNFTWARQVAGDSMETAYSLCIDAKDNLYATGYFTGNCDLDPGTSTHIVTSRGKYDAFTLKLGNGVPLGISDMKVMRDVTVYPNPTSGEVYISFSNYTDNVDLRVIGMMGQLIMEKRALAGRDLPLSLSDQAAGVYFLEIAHDRTVTRIKIVKN